MERNKIIEKVKDEVNKAFKEYKDYVVNKNKEDYCDEMALMYSFRKYCQYIESEEDEISNKDLEIIYDNIDIFIDDFIEIYWNSNLGNSYADIKKMLDELVEEYKMRGE